MLSRMLYEERPTWSKLVGRQAPECKSWRGAQSVMTLVVIESLANGLALCIIVTVVRFGFRYLQDSALK